MGYDEKKYCPFSKGVCIKSKCACSTGKGNYVECGIAAIGGLGYKLHLIKQAIDNMSGGAAGGGFVDDPPARKPPTGVNYPADSDEDFDDGPF